MGTLLVRLEAEGGSVPFSSNNVLRSGAGREAY